MNEFSRTQLYPWQLSDWEQLRQYQNNEAIPHALLITGKEGLAKFSLATLWAKTLLCETILPGSLSDTDSKACGHCPSCELFQAGTHPDYLCVEPTEPGKAIKVDQIRDVVKFVSLTRTRSNIRVIIICPAEAMNVNAANSLLKTLEEPPENTVLILLSSNNHSLPATIHSRCQHMSISSTKPTELRTWLAENGNNSADELDLALSIAENVPLKAQFYLDSSIYAVNTDLLTDWQLLASGKAKPSTIAEKWLKQPDNLPIKLVYTWVVDMIRYHSTVINEIDDLEQKIFYHKNNQQLINLAGSIPLKRLFGIYDKVIDILKLQHTSLNNQLQLESLLIQWSLIAQSK